MARSRTGAWRWTRLSTRQRSFSTGERRRALVLPDLPLPGPVGPSNRDRRPLTELEVIARTDFDGMEEMIEKEIVSMLNGWREVKRQHIAELSRQVRQANNDPVKIAKSSATPRGTDLLARVMRKVVQDAGNAAIKEAAQQGATIAEPDTSAAQAYILRRAESAAIVLARSISDSATRQALRLSSPAVTPNSVAAGVRAHLEALSDAFLREHFNALLVGSVNLARKTVFEGIGSGRYYSSAVLDRNTCSNCRSADGKRYPSLLAIESEFPFGGRADCKGRLRCRCTVIGIFVD